MKQLQELKTSLLSLLDVAGRGSTLRFVQLRIVTARTGQKDYVVLAMNENGVMEVFSYEKEPTLGELRSLGMSTLSVLKKVKIRI